jgi:hypothetical protein
MNIPSISSVSHDLGSLPAQPVRRPPRWAIAVPLAFWLSIVAIVGFSFYRSRAVRQLMQEELSVESAVSNADTERLVTAKRITALHDRYAYAQRIDDWCANAPALAPALGAILIAFEDVKIRLTDVHMARHPGDTTAFDLQITLVGNGDIGPFVTKSLDDHLLAADWSFIEESVRPLAGTLEIDALIAPQSTNHARK